MRVIQTILFGILTAAVLSIAAVQVIEWITISCGDIISVTKNTDKFGS